MVDWVVWGVVSVVALLPGIEVQLGNGDSVTRHKGIAGIKTLDLLDETFIKSRAGINKYYLI